MENSPTYPVGMLKLPVIARYLRCPKQALRSSLFPGCGADTSQMVLGYSQDYFLPHSCWPTHGSCTHYLQALLPVCLAVSSSFPQKHWNLLLERKASNNLIGDLRFAGWKVHISLALLSWKLALFCTKELQLPKLLLFYKSCRYTFIYTGSLHLTVVIGTSISTAKSCDCNI